MYLYFRAYITFKTRGEAKKCVEDTKDMTVEDRKVRLQLNGKMKGICGTRIFEYYPGVSFYYRNNIVHTREEQFITKVCHT